MTVDPAWTTADLCDEHGDDVHVADAGFVSLGGVRRFAGPASTVKCFEDNTLVKAALAEPGEGRVLVVDGGGSLRHSLVGDNLAASGARNGWAGVIVRGAVRDSAILATIDLGVLALGTIPRRTVKRGEGQRDVPVRLAGVTVRPGDRVYADEDGWIVHPA